MLADFVNRADVGMVQRRSGSRLPPEALQGLRARQQIIRQELQRDVAFEAQVLRLVHHTHPASPELLQDVVVRNGLADQSSILQNCNLPQ